MVGSVESSYLDTYQGVLALERDKGTVGRLTLNTTATPRTRDKKEERKKPPAKSLSSGSLLKEYRVEKTRPTTPSVEAEIDLDIDEEQAALLLGKTLKGRSVQLRLMKGRARRQDQIEAMRTENPVTEEDMAEVQSQIDEENRLRTERESLQSKEDYINSFLDRLEGETLGKLMDYLSLQLTDSATNERARDMAEDTEKVELARQKEQDVIFSEIVKVNSLYIMHGRTECFQVTQNTVDKYLDDILLETVYTVAHEETLQEMGLSPREVRKEEEEEGAVRRASASESQDSAREAGNWQERSAVKQKMKATQRKYLSAAHDQIWGMLDQFKQRGEVSCQ